MLRRPSSRRSTSSATQVSINLVPILDALVTLITFLLFSMSFLEIVSVNTFLALGNPSETAKPGLQLTLTIKDNELEVWSPIQTSVTKRIPHLANGKPDLETLHAFAIDAKKAFPNERALIVVPKADLPYENLVQIIDAARVNRGSTDMPVLFNEVIFGNLLSDGDGA